MEESTKEVTVNANEMLANATGPLEYGLTNDYLFKAFLQKNQRVLRALVASLLHMEEENHHVFSRKLAISVLDLNQIENATEEDKAYQIDYWARLFKASTWEELKMLASESEVMKDCVVTICELTADERARMQMEAREEHNRVIRTYEHRIEGLEAEKAEMSAEIERLKTLLEQAKK